MKKEKWEREIDNYIAFQDLISYGSAFILAALCGVWFESLVFFFSFWVIRCSFPLTYHSDSWDECKYWTRLILFIGVLVLPTVNLLINMFSAVLMALLASFSLYKVKAYINSKQFSIKTASKEELRNQCINKGLLDGEIQECILLFKSIYKGTSLDRKLCCCTRTTIRKRKYYKNLLEN